MAADHRAWVVQTRGLPHLTSSSEMLPPRLRPVSFRRSTLPLKWSSEAVDPFYMNILYVIIAVLVIIVLLRFLGVV